jgi:hypothetical protein
MSMVSSSEDVSVGQRYELSTMYRWTCACCGREFDELPMDIAVGRAPASYEDLAEDERARATLTSDFCVIEAPDQTDRFVRAVLELPVHDFAEPFRWGVWVSLSEPSFARAKELFRLDVVPPDEPERFGWLSSRIWAYSPTTLNLKTMVTFRGENKRPLVRLEPTDHPLSLEHRNGITVGRVQELVAPLLHRSRPPHDA